MKILKISSILLLSTFFLGVFSQASARHECRHCTSFGLSFNVGSPSYAVAPVPVIAAPAPVYSPYAPAPIYPYYYNAPVVVERPNGYVQPGFSYSYRRY